MSDETPPPPPPPPPPGEGYGTPVPPTPSGKPAPRLEDASSKKILAGILAIVVGSLGIHKFVLGYTTAGIIMLLVTVLTCGIGGIVMGVIGIVEGIMYLTKSDQEFYDTYMAGEKAWF
jgi:TM2 domain-containing membrane protein YozV